MDYKLLREEGYKLSSKQKKKKMDTKKRLTRSMSDKMIGGVCSGIAHYFDWDPTIVRLVYLLLTFGTCFSGIIVYIILLICMPEDWN